jgi:hypothetical protein
VRSEFVQKVRSRTLDASFAEPMAATAVDAAAQEQIALIWKELAPALQREAAKVTRDAGDDLIEQVQPC